MTIALGPRGSERVFRRPLPASVRRRLEDDLSIVFRMLNRSDWVREFILASNVPADLLMLMSPLGAQSSFILETEEHQEGRLTGSIKMRYLVVPSFTTPDGLSGGAIVTTYARRNHPLHAPAVMANTRIGRYVRDNQSGEWLFLTRNEIDNVTRMQWLHSSKSTARERINLTCNSTLFNKGLFSESILFECHDEEWRVCPVCHSPPDTSCTCSTSDGALVIPKHPLDLSTVAAAALTEPKSEWFGRVQVSVLSNLTKDLPGDLDTCMNLRTSFEASQDASLALQMQNLALAERARSVIPKHVAPPKMLANGHATGAAAAFGIHPSAVAGLQYHGALHVPVLDASDAHKQAGSCGMLAQFMSEMVPAREDAVVPESGSRVAKKARGEASGHANGGHAFGGYLQPGTFSPAIFDPTMAKHSAGGDVNSGGVLQAIPVQLPHRGEAHHPAMQHEKPQSNGHSAVANGHARSEVLLQRPHEYANPPHPRSAPCLPKPQVNADDSDDDDTGGVHRMPLAKSFDAFLGSFIAPQPDMSNATVDVSGLDHMDLAENAWLAGPAPAVVPKGPACQQPEVIPVGSPIAHTFPPHHLPSAMLQRVPDAGIKQISPVTPEVSPPLKHNGQFADGAKLSRLDGDHQPLDPDADDGAPLARLEPRPPGMAASGEGAWMWHMGPRGPFGVAAIAAARERERRAEERRRKNREAAARSNARAKERLERIKGELEKNRSMISRLSRKRKELESQNCTLRQRLEQHAN